MIETQNPSNPAQNRSSVTDRVMRSPQPVNATPLTTPETQDNPRSKPTGKDETATLSAGENGLPLLYRAIIDKLNERLAAQLGPEAIDRAFEQQLDVSPEATADRIVSASTAFFDAYRKQHPEMDEEEAMQAFMEEIGRGVDQGFAEARDILDGLKVLQGSIAENIDKTYNLVQQGLENFRSLMLERLNPEANEAQADREDDQDRQSEQA